MKDSKRGFAVHLGKAQIDAMFTRQAAAPIDDSEFLPLLEVMLTAYEKILPLNEIAPRLLVEPYRTFDIHNDVVCDGWTRMVTALREHGEGLSLPAGAESPEAVVPVEVRHKLRLQACFDSLSGLGQDESLTLEDPEQQYRIESFIECLRDCRHSVAFFALTLESLCARLILPTRDQLLFTQLMKQSLGLRLDREPIAGVL